MSSTKTLPERIDAIHRDLRSLRRRFRLGGWITLLVGGLLLLLVATYFTYGYSEISSLRDPDLIVSLVGNTIDQQIPLARQRIESEVHSNARTWAEQASGQVLAAIPPARQQIEHLALQQADTMIAKIDVLGEQQFRRILTDNRPTVQQAIEQLKNDQEISEDVVLALQMAIEKELQIDAKNQADALLAIVSDLNRGMKKLHTGEELSPHQQAERRVLMLARRLQVERFGDVKLEQLNLPVVEELVGDMERSRLKKELARAEGSQAVPAEQADAVEDPPAEESAVVVEEKKPADEPEDVDKPAESGQADPAADAAKEPADAAEEPAEKAPEGKEAEKEEAKPEEKNETPAQETPAGKPEEEAKPTENGTPAEQ